MTTRGTVKWYSAEKGFGYAAPHTGGLDVFIHASALKIAGIDELDEGDVVEFELETRKGRDRAKAVRLVKRAALAAGEVEA